MFVVAIEITSAASSFSPKCAAASFQTSSGTASARSLSRVIASVSARAARSASVNYGDSRQAATVARRSSVSPAFFALWKP